MKYHRVRILAMQALFQREFHSVNSEEIGNFLWIDYDLPPDERDLAMTIIAGALNNQTHIDEIINSLSKNWNLDRISPVNRSILRISIFQLENMKQEFPPKVVIDEAIKLSIEYAEEDSSRFINGLLDSYYQELQAKTE